MVDARPLLLSSTVRRDNVLMSVDMTNPDIFGDGTLLLPRGTLHVYRSQFLWHDWLYMSLRIRNFALTPVEIGFALEFGADFVDIFEVRGEKRERRGVLKEPGLPQPRDRAGDVRAGLGGTAHADPGIAAGASDAAVAVALHAAASSQGRAAPGIQHWIRIGSPGCEAGGFSRRPDVGERGRGGGCGARRTSAPPTNSSIRGWKGRARI